MSTVKSSLSARSPARGRALAVQSVLFFALTATHPRAAEQPAEPSPAPPQAGLRLEVNAWLDYVRIHDLAHDLPLVEHGLDGPAMVVDLRYVRAGLDESLAFGGLLARNRYSLRPAATIEPKGRRREDQPVIVVVNRKTAGALEAVLDALQAGGEVLLVGSTTAGDTRASETGDHHRTGGLSLLGVGVKPALVVDVSPVEERIAYDALEAGATIPALLDPPVEKPRFDEARLLRQFDEIVARAGGRAVAPAAPQPADDPGAVADAQRTASEAGPAPGAFDRSLQRAVNVLVALEALRRLPPVPPGT